MSRHLGDFPAGATVDLMWNTNGQDGASITRSTDGTLKIYKNNSATERSSLVGVTQTEDFDAATGVHHIRIDLSDNTDAGFYAAGNEYHVVMTGMTIDTKTVNAHIASFSIERAGGILALLKGTNSLANIYGAIDTEVGAIKAKTDQLTFTIANQVDVNVIDWKSATAPAMTGDAYARLGAPTGATIEADLVTINTNILGVKAKTDNLTATPASTGDAMALTAGERISVADALLDRNMATGADSGGRTVRNALRPLRNKVDLVSVAGFIVVSKEDDSTEAWRAALTTDAAANPITVVDPT
jgi:hypothetical protein